MITHDFQQHTIVESSIKFMHPVCNLTVCDSGLEPVQLFTKDDSSSAEGHEKSILQPWNGPSLEEIIKREPYLALATLFLCLRVLLYASPKALSHLKAFYVSYIPHFNLEIFGETSQFFGRILHMIDVRRIWTKLRLCKTRNFHERAKNCRVWASSLASVSLGESSSSTRSQSWGISWYLLALKIKGRKELTTVNIMYYKQNYCSGTGGLSHPVKFYY